MEDPLTAIFEQIKKYNKIINTIIYIIILSFFVKKSTHIFK